MITRFRIIFLCLTASGSILLPRLNCQTIPTATRPFHLSTFAAGDVTYTGVQTNRNYGITAGADVGFQSRFGLQPSLEVRGTYPFAGGVVRSRNILGGVKLAHPYKRLSLYGDALFGRGQINYGSAGVPNPTGTVAFVQTPSNVFSFGLGADFNLNRHFALKADAQLQRYAVPVVDSGHVFAKPISVGVAYNF